MQMPKLKRAEQISVLLFPCETILLLDYMIMQSGDYNLGNV